MKKGGRGARGREEREQETRGERDWVTLSRALKIMKMRTGTSSQEGLLSCPSVLSPNGSAGISRARSLDGGCASEKQREEKDDEAAAGCGIGEPDRKGR